MQEDEEGKRLRTAALKNIESIQIARQRAEQQLLEANIGRDHRIANACQRQTVWSNGEAHGQPLKRVFEIFNEDTRQPVENLIAKVLESERIVGLANHTSLRATVHHHFTPDRLQ